MELIFREIIDSWLHIVNLTSIVQPDIQMFVLYKYRIISLEK